MFIEEITFECAKKKFGPVVHAGNGNCGVGCKGM